MCEFSTLLHVHFTPPHSCLKPASYMPLPPLTPATLLLTPACHPHFVFLAHLFALLAQTPHVGSASYMPRTCLTFFSYRSCFAGSAGAGGCGCAAPVPLICPTLVSILFILPHTLLHLPSFLGTAGAGCCGFAASTRRAGARAA